MLSLFETRLIIGTVVPLETSARVPAGAIFPPHSEQLTCRLSRQTFLPYFAWFWTVRPSWGGDFFIADGYFFAIERLDFLRRLQCSVDGEARYLRLEGRNRVDPFLSKLGIELPIIQAPMAGVSTPEMAAAVSNAGGLGSIGIGAVDADGASKMIAAVRSQTDRAFQVNVFCHRPATADGARELAWLNRLRPEFAHFGATPPERLAEIYQTFLTDDAKLRLLLAERPAVVSFHFGLPGRDRIEALRKAGIKLLATATNLHEGKAAAAAGIDAVVAQGYEAGGHRGMFDPSDAG